MLNIAKWIGTAFTIAGALATAAKLDPLNVVFFNIGTIAWLYAAIKMKEKSLIAVNAGLLAIYVVGAIIRL